TKPRRGGLQKIAAGNCEFPNCWGPVIFREAGGGTSSRVIAILCFAFEQYDPAIFCESESAAGTGNTTPDDDHVRFSDRFSHAVSHLDNEHLQGCRAWREQGNDEILSLLSFKKQ